MIIAVALAVFIPLGFWLFDVIVKLLGAFQTDDVGADLCLFGVSFSGSTLLASAMSSQSARATAPLLSALTGGSLVISLIIYMFSMVLISPSPGLALPVGIRWLRNRSWRVAFTVFLGFFTVAVEIALYVLVLQGGGGRP
jgi:hypothetical protein